MAGRVGSHDVAPVRLPRPGKTRRQVIGQVVPMVRSLGRNEGSQYGHEDQQRDSDRADQGQGVTAKTDPYQLTLAELFGNRRVLYLGWTDDDRMFLTRRLHYVSLVIANTWIDPGIHNIAQQI